MRTTKRVRNSRLVPHERPVRPRTARSRAKEAGMRACVGILPGVLTGLLLAVSSGGPAGAVPQNEVRAAASASHTQAIRQFTTQYCVSCHNGRLNTGGLALDARDFDHLGADAEVWEKVIRKVQVGMMP